MEKGPRKEFDDEAEMDKETARRAALKNNPKTLSEKNPEDATDGNFREDSHGPEGLDREVKRREAEKESRKYKVKGEMDEEEIFDREVAERGEEKKRKENESAVKKELQEDPHGPEGLERESARRKVFQEEKKSGEIPTGEEGIKAETVRYEDKEIRELSEKLDAARRAYVFKNNERNKHSSLFKKVFGFGKGPRLKEFNAEFEEAKTNYESALKAYKDAIVGSMVADKGDAEIMARFLNKGEHLNIAGTRDQIRAESSGWPEKLKNGYVKMLDGYRKLPVWKKVFLGVGLAGAGLASGAWAGAAATGTLMAARRLFSASVGSLGYSHIFEGIAEKKRAGESEAEARGIAAESQSELGEIDIEKLNVMLDTKISGINQEIQSRDLAKRWRTYGAIGAGVATSFLGNYFSRYLAESDVVKTATEYWKPKASPLFEAAIGPDGTVPEKAGLGETGQPASPEAAGVPDGTPEQPGSPDDAALAGADEEAAAVPAFEKSVGYQDGKSVWEEAQKQLEARFKDSFNNLGGADAKVAEALKIYNIDRIKDLIVADPEKFGLPKDVDFNRMSVGQLEGIKWDAAFEETFGGKGLVEDLSAQVENPSVDELSSIEKNANLKLEDIARQYKEAVISINSFPEAYKYDDLLHKAHLNNMMALLGGDYINTKDFNAQEYMSAQGYINGNKQSDPAQLLEAFKKMVKVEDAEALEPKAEETMFDWATRVATIMRKSFIKVE